MMLYMRICFKKDRLIIPLLIVFILFTCLLDIVSILYGEILSWSLMRVKGLMAFTALTLLFQNHARK